MQRIYARNTIVRKISNEDADNFISKNHRQGLPQFSRERYNAGLFANNDELVGEISLCTPRTKAKSRLYQHELIRMTFKQGVQVIGGASKMISFYINDFKPRNFFTYQTVGGINSDVYEKCGMTLRKTGTKKEVLVKNGYTYMDAVKEHFEKGTKYLYLNSQLMRLGPDAVLNTHLGRKTDGHGNWLTNPDLFIEFCNYHKEMVPGDNVYDYNNDKYIHYVYKLTSSDPNDHHYYIGRHSIYTLTKREISDFINDGYLGSGGPKFEDWKHQTRDNGFKIVKKILSVQQKWTDNLKAEKEAIGDKYSTDENCLNVLSGGMADSASMSQQNAKLFHKDVCPIHGETTFRGSTCLACNLHKYDQVHEGNCPIHGKTAFRGNKCIKCWTNQAIHQAICPIHGKTTFRGDTCLRCKNNNEIYYDTCKIHGRTKFKGGSCCKCIANSVFYQGICPIHGKTTFAGKQCLKCKNNRSITHKWCDKCQKVTGWNGKTCMGCASRRNMTKRICPIHGETTFMGDRCMKCIAAKKPKKPKKKHVTTRVFCDKCGKVTRHVDGKCMSCKERALYHQDTCPIHGLTKFRGKKCCACRAAKMREDRKRKKAENAKKAEKTEKAEK